jgi:hypothetical protein
VPRGAPNSVCLTEVLAIIAAATGMADLTKPRAGMSAGRPADHPLVLTVSGRYDGGWQSIEV